MIKVSSKVSDRLPLGFLGNLIQVCVVSADYRYTVNQMLKAGIGPWQTYTFDASTNTHMTYYGRPGDFSLKLCFGWAGSMFYEVVQPLGGQSIHQDFLDQHGEGIQHLAFDCNKISWDEKVTQFNAAGFRLIQSGCWIDKIRWGYFNTEDTAGTTIEIWNNPADWQRPQPDEIIE